MEMDFQTPDPNREATRAERALLGGVFRCPGVLDEVAGRLHEDHFREVTHRLVWRGVLALYRDGKPVDLVGLAEWLARAGLIDQLASTAETAYTWLANLWDEQPTGALVAYHAEIVRDHALLRGLALAGHEIAHRASHPDATAQELLADAERKIFALAEGNLTGAAVPLPPVIEEVLDLIDQRMANPAQVLSGLLTGIPSLDVITAGLQQGELILVAARPSVGKTSFGLTVARNVAASGSTVLFCSLEQSVQELAQRLLVATSGIEGQAIRHAGLSLQDLAALRDARGVLLPMAERFWVDDTPLQTVLRIASTARKLKRRENLALVVIDYAQLIGVDPEERKLPRHEQVGNISRRLKALARDLGIPVLALAQLNRGVEDRPDQKPRLSDLRESGSLEQDGDVVILLHRQRDWKDRLDLQVAKQRNGPTGECSVLFDRARMRFSDLSQSAF